MHNRIPIWIVLLFAALVFTGCVFPVGDNQPFEILTTAEPVVVQPNCTGFPTVGLTNPHKDMVVFRGDLEGEGCKEYTTFNVANPVPYFSVPAVFEAAAEGSATFLSSENPEGLVYETISGNESGFDLIPGQTYQVMGSGMINATWQSDPEEGAFILKRLSIVAGSPFQGLWGLLFQQ